MENFWFDIQRFDGEEEDPEVTYNSDDNVQITGTNGKDAIYNGYYDEEENFVKAGSNVSISGGAGDDYIENIGGSRAVINGGDDNDEIFNYSIWLGDEETGEEYEIRPDFATINGGAGDDKIDNIGNNSSITGGDGNDNIYNNGDNATINGGEGDDYIYNDIAPNVTIDGGTGNDYIGNYGGSGASINGGEGDDQIENASTWIEDEETGEEYHVMPNYSTIEGGAGNDYIYNEGENVTFVYSGGNDTIEGFNETSTLDLGGASYNSEIDGDDVIVYIDDGSVRLIGAALFDTLNIEVNGEEIYNSDDNAQITGTDGKDTIYNQWGDNVSIDSGAGDDTIRNYGANVSIDGGDGDDEIDNTGNKVSINAGDGDDYIGNDGENVAINGGAGNDYIYNSSDNGNNTTIDGGDGDDEIDNTGANVSISGGAGDDSIHNDGNNVTINAGDGNDYIFNSDSGNNTTIDGGDGNDEIDNEGTNVIISGGAGDDTIYNWDTEVWNAETQQYDTITADNSTLLGGAGDDYISNINGENVTFVYASGDGNDTINGFNETSTLSIASGTYTSKTSGNDVIVYTGNGTVLLVGAAELDELNIEVGGGNESISGNGENIYNDKDNVYLIGTGASESIDNRGNNVTIDAGAGDDTIQNGGANALIDGGDGNDLINIWYNNYNDTIDGGDGNDSIYGAGQNNQIYGGDGDDYIEHVGDEYSGNELLDGGAGDDTISNSCSNVTINAGEGDDVIKNWVNAGAYVLINGDEGNDWLEHRDDYSTINGGEGDDTVIGYGNNMVLNGDDGNDYFFAQDDNINTTIIGGAGDDSIDSAGTNTSFVYNFGDGDDTINGFDETSLLDLGGASYYKTRVGRDILVNVDGGSILLLGAASLSAINIDGEEVFHPVWTVKNTTATYGTADETLFTITGLKNGLTAEYDYIEGIYFDGDTIYLSANVLGSTNVSVTGDGYYLALGEDVEEPEETAPEWNLLGSTAKLTTSTSAGYTLSEDEQSITYTAERSSITLATITGLKRGLSEEELNDGTYVDSDSKEITLTSDVLGTTNVSISGDYTLALGDDVYPPEAGDPEWTVSGKTSTTATLSNMTSAGYELSEDYKSITYTPEKAGEAIATITGLAKGLKAEDGYIEGVDFDGDVITLSKNVLGTTNVNITSDSGYYLALGDGVKEPEETAPEWSMPNGSNTAKLTYSTAAGYTLSEDEQSITYTAERSSITLATITGLKRGLSEDELNDGTYVDSDSKEITLTSDVLGTTNVSISGDYTLALGDDVYPPEAGDPEWTVSGKTSTTATLSNMTSAGYELSEDYKSITYTPEKAGEAIATITGLAKGLKAEDGYIEGVDFDGDVITLSENVLGTTNVNITSESGYSLALGDGVTESTSEPELKITSKAKAASTTAVLGEKRTEGYTLSEDAQSITYTSDKTATIATLTGLKKGLTEDELNDGIEYDIDSETITLYASVLGTTKVTVKDSTKNTNYQLLLGDDVAIEPEPSDVWTVKSTTATFKSVESAYFSESTNGKTIDYKAETKGTTLATIKGLASGLSENDDGTIDGIEVDGETIYLSADVLGNKKITLTGNDYVLALGDDVTDISTVEDPTWAVSGTKATLSTTTTTGYALSDDEKSITYNAKEKTAAVVTLTGIKSGLDSDEVDAAIEYDLDEKVITLSADVLGTSKITVKEKGYTLALDDDYEPEPVEDAWIISGTKATLSDGTSEGYTLSKDARSITYTAAKATGKAKSTISGLKKGATAEDLDFDGETITLYDNALNKKKITLKGDYALALGDDVTDIAEQSDDPAWKVSGTKATLNITTSAGYSCDGSTITYSTKETTTAVATISGLKKGTTADALEFDGDTIITMTADTLGNKVSINGAGYEFAVDGDYSGTITGTKTADVITVNGVGATINAGKGDDQLTTAGGNTFLYASGDGDDVIADFTEDDRIKVTSGTFDVDTDGADVVVTVTKGKTVGTITLTEAAGQTISILDSKNKATTYETTAADNNPYWFIDDDFETTPQLADITATTDCMLGEMDIATDPTQLVQTTPIVTASTKK